MQKKNWFMRMLDVFENSFMKNHSCICCYKEIPDDTKFMLCNNCEEELEYLKDGLCDKCGDHVGPGGICVNNCKNERYIFSKNVSLFYYVGAAAKIVKNLQKKIPESFL